MSNEVCFLSGGQKYTVFVIYEINCVPELKAHSVVISTVCHEFFELEGERHGILKFISRRVQRIQNELQTRSGDRARSLYFLIDEIFICIFQNYVILYFGVFFGAARLGLFGPDQLEQYKKRS